VACAADTAIPPVPADLLRGRRRAGTQGTDWWEDRASRALHRPPSRSHPPNVLCAAPSLKRTETRPRSLFSERRCHPAPRQIRPARPAPWGSSRPPIRRQYSTTRRVKTALFGPGTPPRTGLPGSGKANLGVPLARCGLGAEGFAQPPLFCGAVVGVGAGVPLCAVVTVGVDMAESAPSHAIAVPANPRRKTANAPKIFTIGTPHRSFREMRISPAPRRVNARQCQARIDDQTSGVNAGSDDETVAIAVK